MPYSLLADILVALHLAYVLFVLVGLGAIWIGIWRRWHWIRNPWFRLAHLAAIAVVAFQALFGFMCPLTVWEYRLRVLAGEQGREGAFVGRILDRLLFYDFPDWVFVMLYSVFGLLVLATFFAAPPRRFAIHRKAGPHDAGASS